MASVTTYLDIRRIKSDGTYPLKLNVSVKRDVKFLISLNIDITAEQWNGFEIVKHDRRQVLNQYIRTRLNQIEEELLKLEFSGRINSLTTDQVKDHIQHAMNRTSAAACTVAEYWGRFLGYKERQSTIEGYKNTLVKIGTFANLNTLTFQHITPVWLRDFERHMKGQELAVNTIFTHMRNLRAVFNDAINTDTISQADYPFRKYKITTERTVKRSLTVDQLRLLRDYPCQEHHEKYRDIFMLIFYLEGINVVDLVGLKGINDGRIEFRRAKTGRLYSIKVEPEAMAIIDRYHGNNYLLDVMEKWSNHKDFLHRMNNNLQQIGPFEMVANNAKNESDIKKNKKQITPLFPGITSYWARHTWATIAASLDIPKETIAAALGHGGNTVTDIYIDFDQRKVDAANRNVIDYLNGDTSWLD